MSKCLHYYFYIIDETLGLCYRRVPTWVPFRLQFYCNGHNWLASELNRNDIKYPLMDNAFNVISDFAAQRLSDHLDVEVLHSILDRYSRIFCPVLDTFDQQYHWSIMQAEYATDIVFKEQHVQVHLRRFGCPGHSYRKAGQHCHFSRTKTAR